MKNKTIQINGKKYNLDFHDEEKIWMGDIELKNKLIYFEIEYSKDFSWQKFKDFFPFLQKGKFLEEIIIKSEKLLLNYLDVVKFGMENDDNIEQYQFKFSSLEYKQNEWCNLFKDPFEYNLIFDLFKSGYANNYDPYGLYRIHLRNGLITGFSRQQV